MVCVCSTNRQRWTSIPCSCRGISERLFHLHQACLGAGITTSGDVPKARHFGSLGRSQLPPPPSTGVGGWPRWGSKACFSSSSPRTRKACVCPSTKTGPWAWTSLRGSSAVRWWWLRWCVCVCVCACVQLNRRCERVKTRV